MVIRSLRGMNDLFESDLVIFRHIESVIYAVCQAFGYQEIRTPMLEELALFKRTVGEASDIVEKEMFLVLDGEHMYCLRPENTAPVVRALVERGGLSSDLQEKLYYIGPMFRKERPQKGRLRQFHQFGVEIFGVAEPSADVEIMVMINHLFTLLKLAKVTLKINTLGLSDERQQYKMSLRDFLLGQANELCEDCKRRIQHNPLRILDCKNEHCRQIAHSAPTIVDYLGIDSQKHFEQVMEGLFEQGILFEVDNYLVRGLDYYNRTVFEFVADIGLGAQNAVAAGGRYDGLFATLGNKIDLPAIGCSAGIERIVLLLDQQLKWPHPSTRVALVSADEKGRKLAMNLAFLLRKAGISADFSLHAKSLKAQMRRADKLDAQFIAVLGEQEIKDHRVIIKSLSKKTTHELALDAQAIANFLSSN